VRLFSLKVLEFGHAKLIQDEEASSHEAEGK